MSIVVWGYERPRESDTFLLTMDSSKHAPLYLISPMSFHDVPLGTNSLMIMLMPACLPGWPRIYDRCLSSKRRKTKTHLNLPELYQTSTKHIHTYQTIHQQSSISHLHIINNSIYHKKSQTLQQYCQTKIYQ